MPGRQLLNVPTFYPTSFHMYLFIQKLQANSTPMDDRIHLKKFIRDVFLWQNLPMICFNVAPVLANNVMMPITSCFLDCVAECSTNPTAILLTIDADDVCC